MSGSTRTSKRRAVLTLGVTAGMLCSSLALVGIGGTPSADAAPSAVSLIYRCKFPFIGEQDVQVKVSTNMPKKAIVDELAIPALEFKTVSLVNSKTTQGLRALDGMTIEGAAKAEAVLRAPEFPNGLRVVTGARIEKRRVPPGGAFSVKADGSATRLVFSKAGAGRIEIKDLTLRPVLKRLDGSVTDLDGLEVPCTYKSGNKVLAEFDILEKDEEPPTAPTAPRVVAQTGRSITLDWNAADDNIGVGGYVIYNGEQKLLETYGGETTATLPATPNTAYSLTVQARDYGHNLSGPSAPVTVNTGPDVPERVPPSAPGKPEMTHAGGSWIRIKWPESTDNVGVAWYDVYANGKLAGTFPGDDPDGWAEGLQPLTNYTLTVKAKDAAGNESLASPPVIARTEGGAPEGCETYPNPPAGFNSRGCVYMAGFTNVKKLNGAAVINDPSSNPIYAKVAYRVVENQYIKARFRFNGKLVSRATFLTFGFMATSATMELTQVGEGTMDGRWVEKEQGYDLTAKAKVMVRIYGATANGSPLNLGPNCVSGTPMTLELKAKPADFKDILEGGVLTGDGMIPHFKGCGGNEDMDALFIGAISGAGNFMKIRQGPLCRPDSSKECRPVAPQR
ncbi:fibronectin type III domain-containing protein [Thermomonospora umbrina]|uniref:Chitodextrinase n=1 Tax=Thermomonospora umbrina TaxID=111806 RepID=A0A3D9STI5_9ACTN|nr:fibronectin type III domain-containing protein [Thermomonospora umbrina]REE97800.1 chitodextrinase [Thermomonospora umbrina]